MKRTAVFLVFCVIVGVLAGLFVSLFVSVRVSVGPNEARGAPSSPFAGGVYSTFISDPVEQQSPDYFYYGDCLRTGTDTCVHNPTRLNDPSTRCVWDADDTVTVFFSGYLDPGQSYTYSYCFINDGTGHAFHLRRSAQHGAPVLDVSLSIDTVTVPIRDQVACLNGYNLTDPGPYPSIANSNGGVGYYEHVAVTFHNPTNKRVSNNGGNLEITYGGGQTDINFGCPNAPVEANGTEVVPGLWYTN